VRSEREEVGRFGKPLLFERRVLVRIHDFERIDDGEQAITSDLDRGAASAAAGAAPNTGSRARKLRRSLLMARL
jgi:hypothetical protein